MPDSNTQLFMKKLEVQKAQNELAMAELFETGKRDVQKQSMDDKKMKMQSEQLEQKAGALQSQQPRQVLETGQAPAVTGSSGLGLGSQGAPDAGGPQPNAGTGANLAGGQNQAQAGGGGGVAPGRQILQHATRENLQLPGRAGQIAGLARLLGAATGNKGLQNFASREVPEITTRDREQFAQATADIAQGMQAAFVSQDPQAQHDTMVGVLQRYKGNKQGFGAEAVAAGTQMFQAGRAKMIADTPIRARQLSDDYGFDLGTSSRITELRNQGKFKEARAFIDEKAPGGTLKAAQEKETLNEMRYSNELLHEKLRTARQESEVNSVEHKAWQKKVATTPRSHLAWESTTGPWPAFQADNTEPGSDQDFFSVNARSVAAREFLTETGQVDVSKPEMSRAYEHNALDNGVFVRWDSIAGVPTAGENLLESLPFGGDGKGKRQMTHTIEYMDAQDMTELLDDFLGEDSRISEEAYRRLQGWNVGQALTRDQYMEMSKGRGSLSPSEIDAAFASGDLQFFYTHEINANHVNAYMSKGVQGFYGSTQALGPRLQIPKGRVPKAKELETQVEPPKAPTQPRGGSAANQAGQATRDVLGKIAVNAPAAATGAIAGAAQSGGNIAATFGDFLAGGLGIEADTGNLLDKINRAAAFGRVGRVPR